MLTGRWATGHKLPTLNRMNSRPSVAPSRSVADAESTPPFGRQTPEVILGPFYPADRVAPRRDDLRFLDGGDAVAIGDPILVNVRVVDDEGTRLQGVCVEFWQANSGGRYRHPGDRGVAPLDPAFDGFASQASDHRGMLMFKTVKPGAYRTHLNEWRAPHIHFQVTSGPFRLVTQMFFPGDPLNGDDRCLRSCRRPEMLVAKTMDSPLAGVAGFAWDIVLPH